MWTDKTHSRTRIENDEVAWLTTVSSQGVPSTALVWFLLENDESILVYSRDPSIRLRNIGTNQRVTLALNSDFRGNDSIVVLGSAGIDTSIAPADENLAYVAKYQATLDDYSWTPRWFAENYPTPIRIHITSVHGK
ncbi:MAG: pyridoxamine 5'-phosphate oxidase family protein [Actinomycetota bacterium]|nr:pyridoxamine 5'-phosphate oxidase family protein [Actinomycetota bacterium]